MRRDRHHCFSYSPTSKALLLSLFFHESSSSSSSSSSCSSTAFTRQDLKNSYERPTSGHLSAQTTAQKYTHPHTHGNTQTCYDCISLSQWGRALRGSRCCVHPLIKPTVCVCVCGCVGVSVCVPSSHLPSRCKGVNVNCAAVLCVTWVMNLTRNSLWFNSELIKTSYCHFDYIQDPTRGFTWIAAAREKKM